VTSSLVCLFGLAQRDLTGAGGILADEASACLVRAEEFAWSGCWLSAGREVYRAESYGYDLHELYDAVKAAELGDERAARCSTNRDHSHSATEEMS
jgi:hypothetical protein